MRPVWLSRNFGQHAATLAGIAASGGEWVVTMDEDGQHDPEAIGALLDTAMDEQADVVYARPTNEPPHGALRNVASRGAKWLVDRLAKGADAGAFSSYRLVLGEVARSVAAYAGPGIYLDVAIAWVANRTATCPVEMRSEGDRPPATTSAAWSATSGGWCSPAAPGRCAGSAPSALRPCCSPRSWRSRSVVGRASGRWEVPGWTSTMILLMVATGVILFSLGVIAEYVGLAVNMAMGKPLYLPVRDRREGPLGRDRA